MRKALFTGLILLCLAAPARAQVSAGLNELNVSANLTGFSGGGESGSAIQMTGAFGRFLTRTWEVGAQLSATKLDDVDLFGAIGGFLGYHFGEERATTVPFVGGQVGFGFGPGPSPLNVGALGGFKFFLVEGGALTLQALLQRTSVGGDSALQYGLTAGISIFFR